MTEDTKRGPKPTSRVEAMKFVDAWHDEHGSLPTGLQVAEATGVSLSTATRAVRGKADALNIDQRRAKVPPWLTKREEIVAAHKKMSETFPEHPIEWDTAVAALFKMRTKDIRRALGEI